MTFKKPVPADRTIVPGTWSDILDDWKASFETSDRGTTALGIFAQDQTTPVLTVPFLQGRASVSLAVDTVLESRTITLNGGHGTLVGEIIELADPEALKFMQSQVINVNVNVITLDQPVNRVYFAATAIAQRSSDVMLINGSVTPQVFSILPLPSQAGDMVRIILEIEGDADMDSASFGSDVALTNGCVIRVSEPGGTFKNLFNFKTNGDFLSQGFDHTFLQPRVPGNNTRAFNSRVTWGGQSKHGVVIRLDGSLNEQLQVVIQDDLTLGVNTKFKITAQGHELQG
jgi:hypothetical protein